MFLYQGMTLIEILISLFLFSFILLGLDAALLTSIKNAEMNFNFALAQAQIESIIEYIEVTKIMNDQLIKKWNQENAFLLPNGRGEIKGHYPHYSLKLMWGQIRSVDCHGNHINRSGCLNVQI